MSETSVLELELSLAKYKETLRGVIQSLITDPNNPELQKIKNDLIDLIKIKDDLLQIKKLAPDVVAQIPIIAEKNTTNTTTSTQDDNEQPDSPSSSIGSIEANNELKDDELLVPYPVGSKCQARWDTDGNWYTSIVESVDPTSGKYIVRFIGFGLDSKNEVDLSNLRPYHPADPSKLTVGTQCLAVYSTDGLYYNAVIDAVNPANNTYSVTFKEYGNKETIPAHYIKIKENKKRPYSSLIEDSSGQLVIPEKLQILPTDSDEVRNTKKKKIHAIKSQFRLKKIEEERNSRQQSWQSFKSQAKKKPGFLTGHQKESIFKSPESVSGKVGVTGSGKSVTNYVQPAKYLKKHHDSEDE